jgi:Fe-S-cluster-containing hydrogenase component 2
MTERRSASLTARELAALSGKSRRQFLRIAAGGTAGALIAGRFLVRALHARPSSVQSRAGAEETVFSMVVVDFNKCTGCRTCETVCSSFNNRVVADGEELPGLGNPALANIRVYPYNPDVDVPVACLMCEDAPCIAACPVEPDAATGRRALYRAGKLPVLRHDPGRCVGCGSCAEACRTNRVGAIIPNPGTNMPERMCSLCGGDPQCVKHCPNGALSHIVQGLPGQHYGLPPDAVAGMLAELWYGIK